MRFWECLTKYERGQALLLVLVCLLFGGILIAASVGYVDVVLRGKLSIERGNQGRYAADAGVEDVIWSLNNSVTPRTALPQNINGLQVTMNTVSQGNYTLVAGDWVSTKDTRNSTQLLISSSMNWDAGANAYKYTVTCTWTGDGQCKLTKVGVKLPLGYDYQTGSAALFGTNLSTIEPADQLNSDGAHMLSWSFSQISLNPTRTQIFHITGSGALENDYAWAQASRNDVGEVGELIGGFHVITATATSSQDGKVAATIVANVMLSGSELKITSWRIGQN